MFSTTLRMGGGDGGSQQSDEHEDTNLELYKDSNRERQQLKEQYERMEAIVANSCDAYMAKAIGMPLTEQNVKALQSWFNKEGSQAHSTQEEADKEESGMCASDKRMKARLEEVTKIGIVDPRSYLGEEFRKFIQSDEDQKKHGRHARAARSKRRSA